MDPARSKRIRKRLLLGALAAVLLGAGVAGAAAGIFVYSAVAPMQTPMATIDSTEPVTVELPDPSIRYAFVQLARSVDGETSGAEFGEEVNKVVGPMPDLTVRDSGGAELPTEPVKNYQTVGANDYHLRRVVAIDRPTTVEITAAIAEDKTSFAPVYVFPYVNDITDRRLAQLKPWWIAAGVLAAAGAGLFALALLLYAMEPDEHFDARHDEFDDDRGFAS